MGGTRDARLNARVAKVAGKLAGQAQKSFPQALSDAELTGYYRLVNHQHVTFDALVEAHVEATRRRIDGIDRAIVAHDTTTFQFNPEVAREGRGRTDGTLQGSSATRRSPST